MGRIKFRTNFDVIQERERERERVRWGQFCQLQRQRLARQIGMAIVPNSQSSLNNVSIHKRTAWNLLCPCGHDCLVCYEAVTFFWYVVAPLEDDTKVDIRVSRNNYSREVVKMEKKMETYNNNNNNNNNNNMNVLIGEKDLRENVTLLTDLDEE